MRCIPIAVVQTELQEIVLQKLYPSVQLLQSDRKVVLAIQ